MTVDHQVRSPATASAGVSRGSQRYPCHNGNPDLWFAEMPPEVEEAKRPCRECPVRPSCLASALRRAEPWGVWGGELLAHGQIQSYKRGRGRPPKQAAAA
jgi:WhiB family transcriptional regulator, redox-sensing transcriptional regulator